MQYKLNVNGKKIPLKNFLDRIIYSSPQSISALSQDLSLSLPRTLRVNAYLKALEPLFKEEHKTLLKLEEENPQGVGLFEAKRLIRLKHRENLSETQLENERLYYNDVNADERYVINFWEGLFEFLIKERVKDDYIYLFIQDTLDSISVESIPKASLFNAELDSCFQDLEGQIDGLSPETFRIVVFHTANKKEITEIGKKFGIDLPRSLNKKEVQKIFLQQLTKHNKLTPKIKEDVLNSTVSELKTLAESLNEEIQIYLTKETLIEYILENAHSTASKYLPVSGEEAYEENRLVISKPSEETIASDQELKEIRLELKEIRKMLMTLRAPNETEAVENEIQEVPQKRLPRVSVLDIFAGTLMLYMFLGLITYFLRDFGVFTTINSLFNRITYRGYGLMEIYHMMIEFIIYG